MDHPELNEPFFSIITATYNVGDSLAATADSLRRQRCRSYEWLIADGGSTDGTVDAIRALGAAVAWWTSGRDTGVYDAFNKALPEIRGRWVLFLGAGDLLHDPGVLADVRQELESLPAEVTTWFGAVTVFSTNPEDCRDVRYNDWQGVDGPWGAGRPRLPSHQGVFQRAELFRRGFRFDTRCRISADNEILLRELVAGRGVKSTRLVARFQDGGISWNPKHRLRMVCESVYINWKVGIFWRRPFYQMAAVANAFVQKILGR